jgi:hypothetical protein
MNKVLGLAAIFAIAVLAGCSSPSLSTSTNSSARHLMGTMDDWVNAVCTTGGPLPMRRGTMLGSSAANPMVCHGPRRDPIGQIPIYIGTYPSESLMENDLNPNMTGTYAEGNNGSEVVVFVSLPIPSGASPIFQPLEAYGFTIHQLRNPPVVSPAPQPPSGNTNAMPPPTAMPPAPGNATSQYVRTESGKARCHMRPDEVTCEASGPGSTGFLQAPIEMPESQCKYSPCPGGMHADQAEVTASGAFHWNDGNIGGVGSDWEQTDTTLNYGQTYHISGWTILPSSDGTRFTNDGTGHGMFVSIENVYSF